MDWLVKHKTLVREIVISCARDSPRSRLTHELANPAYSPVSFQSNRETERAVLMRSRSDLRNSSKERIGFVLFAIFIGSVVWLTHSSASNSSTFPTESPQVQNTKQWPSGCPSCPPPSA